MSAASELDAALSDSAVAATPAMQQLGAGGNRAAVLSFCQAMKEVDRAAEEAVAEHRDAPTSYCSGDGPPVTLAGLMTSRSDDRDPPRAAPRRPYAPLDPENLPPGAVLLTGAEAERYRAMQAAARRSLAAQVELNAAGAELRDAIAAVCQGMAPAGGGA